MRRALTRGILKSFFFEAVPPDEVIGRAGPDVGHRARDIATLPMTVRSPFVWTPAVAGSTPLAPSTQVRALQLEGGPGQHRMLGLVGHEDVLDLDVRATALASPQRGDQPRA